jgi:hypothetical protein
VTSPPIESTVERAIGMVMLIAFWMAFTTLAAGLVLWLALPRSDAGTVCLSAGLLGLLTMPLLRLAGIVATAVRGRDWLLFAATLAVLGILLALTLRDAAGQ